MNAPASPALTAEVVTTRAALTALEGAWNDLLARSAVPSPLFGPAWFQGYLDWKLKQDEPWWVVVLFEGDELRGALPLVLDTRRGGGVRVPAEYFMSDGAPVLEAGREREVAEALLEAAYEAIPQARRIAFGGMRVDAAPHLALASLARTTSRREGEGAAVPIEGDFDPWYRTIGKNMRRNLRKAASRATKDFEGAPLMQFLTGEEADVAWLKTVEEIEGTGWKGEDGGALGLVEDKSALYASVVRRWYDQGILEWHRLSFGGETAALHMAIRLGSKLTLMRICFDERFGRYSPSGLLLQATFERAFADGDIRRLDCVQRQTWQNNWRMEEVPYQDVHAYRPGLAATVLGLWPDRLGIALRGNPLLQRLLRRGSSG